MKNAVKILVLTLLSLAILSGCTTNISRSVDDVNDINNAGKTQIAEIDGETTTASETEIAVESISETEETTGTLSFIDKLPEDQKDAELDAAIAKIRAGNKNGTIVSPDGSVIMTTSNGMDLPGQTKNLPDWSSESNESNLQRVNAISDYLENELKLQKKEGGFTFWSCIDPRINAVYDDEDKSIMAGYENQNIYIAEYETAETDIYSYLFLVRDSKDGDWYVLHQGNSYK